MQLKLLKMRIKKVKYYWSNTIYNGTLFAFELINGGDLHSATEISFNKTYHIIHCDIKPANLLLNVLLLSAVKLKHEVKSKEYELAGTSDYMAKERFSDLVTHNSDIWITAYFMAGASEPNNWDEKWKEYRKRAIKQQMNENRREREMIVATVKFYMRDIKKTLGQLEELSTWDPSEPDWKERPSVEDALRHSNTVQSLQFEALVASPIITCKIVYGLFSYYCNIVSGILFLQNKDWYCKKMKVL
ncbi:uncharacterized protein FOMMEDRAFT_28252 [Fomitiporia mediterranea MF3/22]|uniref:uncharacterized protein n=1 Tax=Fomitiporia mediterranea (strain MF3/22) TaxID=694068 RepID=UPI000440835E|nr:uncharacterized protein FOMMEDRAFT_28252 [Fomitiporia mediterranea MF3/22]EJD04603.1 hypothetical protein FOMMEDRAFT_28252 [Fomitiporia mediterranea MF3/22]